MNDKVKKSPNRANISTFLGILAIFLTASTVCIGVFGIIEKAVTSTAFLLSSLPFNPLFAELTKDMTVVWDIIYSILMITVLFLIPLYAPGISMMSCFFLTLVIISAECCAIISETLPVVFSLIGIAVSIFAIISGKRNKRRKIVSIGVISLSVSAVSFVILTILAVIFILTKTAVNLGGLAVLTNIAVESQKITLDAILA